MHVSVWFVHMQYVVMQLSLKKVPQSPGPLGKITSFVAVA